MLLLFLIDTWTDATGSEALMAYQPVFAPSHASLISAQSFFPSHKTVLTNHITLVGDGGVSYPGPTKPNPQPPRLAFRCPHGLGDPALPGSGDLCQVASCVL